ncbi:MAG: hypothetical protein PHT78_09255, partial [Desulfitobacteriaceae bacterium]|nr:hypothetical protein [Desulfitobacteriaceae bacterium]
MPKATTPAQKAAGYGMATREQAIALSVRTHDKAPEIKASGSNSPATKDTGAKLPDGFPSDLIQIYEGGKITSVEEKAFAG